MLSGSTFVKLYRSLLDWRWYKDSNTMRLFIHLILKANISDGYFEDTIIKRGQLVTSRNKLANELGLSERNIRTALNHLISTNEVTAHPTSKFTIITIVNYDTYQSATDKATNDRPTTDQQATNDRPQYKNKEEDYKNIENNKIYNTSTCVDSCNTFDYQAVVNSFNSICQSLPKVQKLTDTRKKKIKSTSKLLGEMTFEDVFCKVESSDFLSGRNGKWTACCFDWILNPANLTKIIEGNYNNKQPQQQNTPQYTKGVDYF